METLEGRIEQVEIADEMKASYLDYAMSVIVGRALPDVRDGLKPVHRRVLFGMHDAGMQPNRPYRSAHALSGMSWATSTPMATNQFMMHWCGWLRTSPSATRWSTVTAISVPSTVMLLRLCDTRSAG